MSPTAARNAAVPFAMIAFGLRLAVTFWVEPLSFRIGPDVQALAVMVAGFAVSAAVPFALYALVTWPLRRRPASLHVDARRDRFAAPPRPRDHGARVIMLMWLAGGLILTERVPGSDRMRVAAFDFAVPISVTAVTIAAALAALVLLLDRPNLALDRTGVTVQCPVRRSRIGWDDLVPGGPPAPTGRKPKALWVLLKPPPPLGPAARLAGHPHQGAARRPRVPRRGHPLLRRAPASPERDRHRDRVDPATVRPRGFPGTRRVTCGGQPSLIRESRPR